MTRPHIVAVKLTGEELRKLLALAEHMQLSKSDILRLGLRNFNVGDMFIERPDP